ncbi:MAG: valine--tRNA ligase, partial [Chloroflexi bacterium]
VKATDIVRNAFIERCLAISDAAESDYKALWQRLGLSIDWRQTYRTIAPNAQRIAQWSFLDLHQKELAYRQQAPTIWCPECQTAIAQAELNDLERETTFYTLKFNLADGSTLPIATTRPELLPACVAIFVHPEDGRFQHLIGTKATTPHFNQSVPILADAEADPEKGTGAVMCCTFGDSADVTWWHTHKLPLIEAINPDGTMTNMAAQFAGLSTFAARKAIIETLAEEKLLLKQEPISQSVRIHERCDTPVEYIVTHQWFIHLLDHKEALLAAGNQITWHPPHMQNRYTQWVENLGWDWCISRQRYFGVPIPVWYCADCGHEILPDAADLPINPEKDRPKRPCSHCNSTQFIPEMDVMDTWFTSSMTPQIAGQWQTNGKLYEQLYPFTLRPQAYEIIRTWAFYTIAKSYFHFGRLPFQEVAISGLGMAPEGNEKISKSRGGGPVAPMAMIEQYSADAVRYWAASTGLGKNTLISEEKIQAGAKLVNKLWNVSRFSQRFLQDFDPMQDAFALGTLADRWILGRTQQLIERTTTLFQNYDYATAKSEIETFFWKALADNYLEMAKMRLYEGGEASKPAQFALYHTLLTTLKLLAPILPFITERIYLGLFAETDGLASIHQAKWPQINEDWVEETAVSTGETLVHIATAVRRYKSENNLSLGAELPALNLTTTNEALANTLAAAKSDLISISRAKEICINQTNQEGLEIIVD